jgi:hypothetical protein
MRKMYDKSLEKFRLWFVERLLSCFLSLVSFLVKETNIKYWEPLNKCHSEQY